MRRPFADNPELADRVASQSALQLLYSLHALRYPQFHVSFRLSQPYVMPPEIIMLDPRFSIQQKATELLYLLQPVAVTLSLNQQRFQRPVLVEYCHAQPDAEDYKVLHDTRRRPMMADELLPLEHVVQAMTVACRERTNTQAACPELERFIVLGSEPTLLPGYVPSEA